MDQQDFEDLNKMYQQHLQDVFDQLIRPNQLTIKSEFFMQWLEIKSDAELEYALKLFEDVEMYEECAIIKSCLDARNTRD
jgi:hypothetical protein